MTTVELVRPTAATITSNATLTAGKVNPVDATSGVLTVTLPTTATAGIAVTVQKIDPSTNIVNITGSINGATATLTLSSQYESRELRWSGSTWTVTASHRTDAQLDARYQQAAAAAAGDLAGNYPNPTLKAIITGGTVGSSNAIPVLTYDAKGRITGVATATPAGGGSGSASRSITYIPSLGASTDIGPSIQAAYDAGYRHLILEGNGTTNTLYLNTPVFFDATSGKEQTIIEVAGNAKLILGTGLPTASSFTTDTATKWAFFPGTLRSAYNATTKVVTVSDATCSVSGLYADIPAVIYTGGVFNGGNQNSGLSFGNYQAVHVRYTRLEQFKFGTSWWGYADTNGVEHIQWSQNVAYTTGALDRGTIIMQTRNGDGVNIKDVKATGRTIVHDAYQCLGATISGGVQGGFRYRYCGNITIEAQHTEPDGGSTTGGAPTDPLIYIKNSTVSIKGNHFNANRGPAGGAIIQVDDDTTAGEFTDLTLDHVSIQLYQRVADQPHLPDVLLTSLAPMSRVRATAAEVHTTASGTGQRKYAGGLIVSAVQPAVQSAIGSGGFQTARFAEDWEVKSNGAGGAWRVAAPGSNGPIGILAQAAPSGLAVAASTTWNGTLVSGTTYQYVCAVRDPDAAESAISATASVAAGANGAIQVTVTVQSGPTVLRIWRDTGTAVTTTADAYVEIPVRAGTFVLYDTGVNVNGIPWATTGFTQPSAVTAAANVGTTRAWFAGTYL